MSEAIVVLNAGSSSIKFSHFVEGANALNEIARNVLARRIEVAGIDKDAGTTLRLDILAHLVDKRLARVPLESKDRNAKTLEPGLELCDKPLLLDADIDRPFLTVGPVATIATREPFLRLGDVVEPQRTID